MRILNGCMWLRFGEESLRLIHIKNALIVIKKYFFDLETNYFR
jgi:hypothetical protein